MGKFASVVKWICVNHHHASCKLGKTAPLLPTKGVSNPLQPFTRSGTSTGQKQLRPAAAQHWKGQGDLGIAAREQGTISAIWTTTARVSKTYEEGS